MRVNTFLLTPVLIEITGKKNTHITLLYKMREGEEQEREGRREREGDRGRRRRRWRK